MSWTPAASPERVYFDHNATTPLWPTLAAQVPAWLEQFGNPSSIHWQGREPKALLREARRSFSQFINADPLEVVWTSGGSEANNLALKGIWARRRGRSQIIVSAVEHPSVMKVALSLRDLGAQVDIVPVNREGQVDLHCYSELLSENTLLVSAMFASNETGSMLPIAKMAKMAHQVGALFHTDGVQGLGKARVDVKNWQVDLATFAGHKFYSLKGAGALYVRKGVELDAQILGGGQERGRRAGTENVLAIAALGFVAQQAAPVLNESLERLTALRDRLESQVLSEISGTRLTGAGGARVANTSSFVIDGVDGETLLMNLDMRGYCVSTGAACSAGSPEPSPGLLAMGLSRREAQNSLRVSLGWGSTAAQVDNFVHVLSEVVARLRTFQHGERAVHGL